MTASGGRGRWPRVGRVVLGFLFAAAVTGVELLAVARLGQPADHLGAQTPEHHEPPPVVVAPPPTPARTLPLAPPRSARLLASTLTRVPAPAPAPAALAALADLHAPLGDLAAGLPGLALGGLGDAVGGAGLPAGAAPTKVPATARRRPAAEYPRAARREGIEGFVVVRLRVDETGRVVDAVVTEAVPPGVFDESALRAARTYRYEPAQVAGRPVPDTLEQRIVFRLR
jgi:protein TonB